MRQVLGILLLMDGLLLAAAAWMGGDWVVNTQIGYITSALVMGGSMLGYAQMVRSRLASGAIPYIDDREMIDRIDDPHQLYEAASSEPEIPANAETLKATIREEKARHKVHRRSLGETVRDSRAAMSLYRLGAYGVLIVGFLYLRGHHLLQIAPYLIGISLPIAVIPAALMLQKERA